MTSVTPATTSSRPIYKTSVIVERLSFIAAVIISYRSPVHVCLTVPAGSCGFELTGLYGPQYLIERLQTPRARQRKWSGATLSCADLSASGVRVDRA